MRRGDPRRSGSAAPTPPLRVASGRAPRVRLRAVVAAFPVAAALALAAVSVPARADAQVTVVDEAPVRLTLGGYLRSLFAVHDAGYELPVGDRRSGFASEVLRLKWRGTWGDRLVLDVHQRIQARASTAADGLGGAVAGLGVSAVPGRAVDLEWTWIDDERLRARHDIDRLAVTVYTPPADVTVGRQAITWGDALLFPVADLWSRFSPFELDTEEKPGIDALRALAYPRRGLEVDAVVADRGDQDDVSAGARASLSLPSADLYVAAGRLWNEALAAAGLAWLLESVKLRAEAAVARDLDADRWQDPRITLGVDRIGTRWSATAEYHYNGLGAADPDGYLDRLRSETFARGESYYLGRHYLGGLASWTADEAERVRLAGTLLVNLEDPSAAFSPVLTWELGRSARLSFGGLLTWGQVPAFPGGLPALGSEYGTYGDLGYTRFSVYF